VYSVLQRKQKSRELIKQKMDDSRMTELRAVRAAVSYCRAVDVSTLDLQDKLMLLQPPTIY